MCSITNKDVCSDSLSRSLCLFDEQRHSTVPAVSPLYKSSGMADTDQDSGYLIQQSMTIHASGEYHKPDTYTRRLDAIAETRSALKTTKTSRNSVN